MSRSSRNLLFFVGAGLLAALFAFGLGGMPKFGSQFHPYRDKAVSAAVSHATANVVSAVNFDQRAIDTLGEETIFFGSVIGAAALLRPSKEEREGKSSNEGRVLESTRFAGYVLLPVTLVLGFDVVAHGHITPGGGFQGGVVLATGLHLLYVAGTYDALERARPTQWFEFGEVVGTTSFAGLGLGALAVSGSFLHNVFSFGSFGAFLSSGTVETLNAAVGVEVACGVMVLLAHFLEQAIVIGGASAPEVESDEGGD